MGYYKSLIISILRYVHYTQWSGCSSKCGPGWRTRRALCKSISNDSVELDMRFCSREGREPLRMTCDVAQCFYKIIETWSQCSSGCGQPGLETLERRCFETVTKTFVDLAHCGLSDASKPITRTCYRPCVRHVRHAYEWRVTDWKRVWARINLNTNVCIHISVFYLFKCSSKCGFGFKNRTIYCWDLYENKKTYESNCVLKNKPAPMLPCMNVSCGFGWFVSEWSTVSIELLILIFIIWLWFI